MEKAGRNDPCPCGSGKKYKKCCLGPEAGGAVEAPRSGDTFSPAADLAGLGIHPYAFVRMATEPSAQTLSRLSKREIAALREKWSIAKMARLSTDEIVSRLAASGIDASRVVFLGRTDGRISAWGIGSDWVKCLERAPVMHEEDFICLAACELWKRYSPERPSLEMLDDWVAEGYDHVNARQEAKAIDVWLRVWEHVRDRLPPGTTTFDGADAVFKCTQCFNNWIQDFELAFLNGAIKDSRCAEIGIRVLREWVVLFTDEDVVVSFRCDVGQMLFAAGRREGGEEALAAVIRDYPRLPNGYVAFADVLSRPESSSSDVERAIRFLETAWALPVEDAEAWEIEPRIADLKARLAATGSKRESSR